MFVYGIQLIKRYEQHEGYSSMNGSDDEVSESTDCPSKTKIILSISDYRYEQHRINEVQPVVEQLFSEGYKYPVQKCDSSFKVRVTKMVSFGDYKDAQSSRPQEQVVRGTITGYVNIVRPFKPGFYHATIIMPFIGCDPFVIYHHENVDPAKVMDKIIMMCQDFNDYHRNVRNSINRYDWCHYRNWGSGNDSEECSDDSEEDSAFGSMGGSDSVKRRKSPLDPNTIFFCPSESAGGLSKAVRGPYSLQSLTTPQVTVFHGYQGSAIALGTNLSEFNSGDWIYGKVFQDKVTRENFALVVHCYMDSHEGSIPDQILKRYQDRKFTSVSKTNMEFDVNEFVF